MTWFPDSSSRGKGNVTKLCMQSIWLLRILLHIWLWSVCCKTVCLPNLAPCYCIPMRKINNCLFTAWCACRTLLYTKDGTAQTVVHAAMLTLTFWIQLAVSPNHSIQTPIRGTGSKWGGKGGGGGGGGEWCIVVCSTSQQHASVSLGQICEDSFTCFNTEIEAADPNFLPPPSHSILTPGWPVPPLTL